MCFLDDFETRGLALTFKFKVARFKRGQSNEVTMEA